VEEYSLEVIDLSKTFKLKSGQLNRALNRVNLAVERGEFFGLVGESGSGKTTLARCIVRLTEPDSGEIRLLGEEWLSLAGKELRRKRSLVQLIFQDPYTSLNPLYTAEETVREPLRVQKIGNEQIRKIRVRETFDRVGFPPELGGRYPHELSGGQRQRVAIARALILQPLLLIADEPVSALDVPLQAQLTSLFARLCLESGITMIYITHDLRTVQEWSSRIGVMHKGRLVEIGTPFEVLNQPVEKYTRRLVEAAFPGNRSKAVERKD
jgi:ABC-type oligopeptide transport system ATPase subunit